MASSFDTAASRAHLPSKRWRLTGICAGVLLLLGILSMPFVMAGDEASELAKLAELAKLEEALAASGPHEPGALLVWAARFRAIGSEAADARADALARDVLKIDPNHRHARRQLGHVDFYLEILGRNVEPYEDPLPEIVSDTIGYPFIDAYRYFYRKRWLTSASEIRLAAVAAAELEEHARRLEDDAVYRTGVQIRANIAHDARFKHVAFETVWAPPFLVVYVGREQPPALDPAQGEQQGLRRKRIHLALQNRAGIFTQLYREFFRRYGKTHDLRDLAMPWGGRPDYAPGKRNFPDGVPLVVWVFEDAETLRRYHRETLGERIRVEFRGGYFMPGNGWVIVHGFGASFADQYVAPRTALRGGTLQLLHWFTRQRSRWATPKARVSTDFFHVGLAATLTTARVDAKKGLVFLQPEEGCWRTEAQSTADKLGVGTWGQKKAYPLFRLKDLVAFPQAERADMHAAIHWDLPWGVGAVLFHQQSTALIAFLQDLQGRVYRDGFDRYFEAVLTGHDDPYSTVEVFAHCFDLKNPEDWTRLEVAYRAYVQEALQPHKVVFDGP